MRLNAEPRVKAWLDRQPRLSIWITSISVLEIRFGTTMLPAGRRKKALAHALDAALEKLENRILPFDSDAAEKTAELMADRQKRGRPGEVRDTMIAGIVLAHRASFATRNTAHFAELSDALINPWSE
jgi:predicted nucleic acid-binding protein